MVQHQWVVMPTDELRTGLSDTGAASGATAAQMTHHIEEHTS
jgi:hypothetical protein